MREIVPPVLACFTDQDARVRYYACESMYNIAKVAKGEILLFFNEVFDALCKVCWLDRQHTGRLTTVPASCRLRAFGEERSRAPGQTHQRYRV